MLSKKLVTLYEVWATSPQVTAYSCRFQSLLAISSSNLCTTDVSSSWFPTKPAYKPMPHIIATSISTRWLTSVAVASSPRLIASLTAHDMNSREVLSESCSSLASSGCRCDSSTEVTRNAAAERSSESACIATARNADSRPTRLVSPWARDIPALTTNAFVCSTTSLHSTRLLAK